MLKEKGGRALAEASLYAHDVGNVTFFSACGTRTGQANKAIRRSLDGVAYMK